MPEATKIPIPVAPFNDGGRGTYTRDAALMDDIELARRCLSDPRWPITATMRARIIEWLERIMEQATDERHKLNAIKSILSADKLNIEQARLLLDCEKASKPQEVNVNVNVKHRTVIERTRELAAIYASGTPAIGDTASDGDGESVYPGPGEGRAETESETD